jgi:hypothetical protein
VSYRYCLFDILFIFGRAIDIYRASGEAGAALSKAFLRQAPAMFFVF